MNATRPSTLSGSNRVRTPSADALLRTPRTSLPQIKPSTPQPHRKSSFETELYPMRTPNPSTPSGLVALGESENVKVAIRVRSFLEREKQLNEANCVLMKENTCALSVPHRGSNLFTFDTCFWSSNIANPDMSYCSQADLFHHLGLPVVEHATSGMNASIIAYGQTGSGKTYSLFGPTSSVESESMGIIPRILDEVMKRLRERQLPHKVTIAMLEIYMERAYDLFAHRAERAIRGDLLRGFHVMDQRRIEVTKYADVLPLLRCADALKTFSTTSLNERSSRAHTLLEVQVRTFESGKRRTAYIMLVDLAGSERVKQARSEGYLFQQACQINLSLMHLGRCIEAVATRKGSNVISEYRNSALTKLLKEYLGGNAKTMILVTISPALSDVHNTLHALRFADRAKQMKNHAVINEDSLHLQLANNKQLRELFEQRMRDLKLEYELECKQHEVNSRQLELEERAALLEIEKENLVKDKEEHARLSAADLAQIETRQMDLDKLSGELQEEVSHTMDKQRELLEQKENLNTINNALITERKRAEEEVTALQMQLVEVQRTHEEETSLIHNQLEESRHTLKESRLQQTFQVGRQALESSCDQTFAVLQHNFHRTRVEQLEREHAQKTALQAKARQALSTQQSALKARYLSQQKEKDARHCIQNLCQEENLERERLKTGFVQFANQVFVHEIFWLFARHSALQHAYGEGDRRFLVEKEKRARESVGHDEQRVRDQIRRARRAFQQEAHLGKKLMVLHVEMEHRDRQGKQQEEAWARKAIQLHSERKRTRFGIQRYIQEVRDIEENLLRLDL